jgi:hypothetical protein
MDGEAPGAVMLRALYAFTAGYDAALSFQEGELFLELDRAKSDR